MFRVSVEGGGLALFTVASLLRRSGVELTGKLVERVNSPLLLLSQQTQNLLTDVFRNVDLLSGAVKITKRVVAWGGEVQVFAHSGVVISESTLLNRLSKVISPSVVDQFEASWKVISSTTCLDGFTSFMFGTRKAFAYDVAFASSALADACYIEALEDGWLFLVPRDHENASLISVGAEASCLLDQSRVVARKVATVVSSTGSFNAYPQITQPLAGDGWLACGSAAVRFDPIAGEGAGHAIREGILAAAMINASRRGESNGKLAEHYSHRILNGFQRHLEECRKFYSVFDSPWWKSELALLDEGVRWCCERSSALSGTRFRLLNFDLVPC